MQHLRVAGVAGDCVKALLSESMQVDGALVHQTNIDSHDFQPRSNLSADRTDTDDDRVLGRLVTEVGTFRFVALVRHATDPCSADQSSGACVAVVPAQTCCSQWVPAPATQIPVAGNPEERLDHFVVIG